MKMRASRLWVLAVVGCVAFAAASEQAWALTPADVFNDHMVLQRGKPAPVWGWAEPGEKVTVRFAGQSKSAVADPKGKWMVVLDPLKLSTKPAELTIAGKETVAFKDVVVGDVWLCSGQSNMGRSVDRAGIPEGQTWSHPMIRYWGAGGNFPYPVERLDKPHPWTVCDSEETIRPCVAVGFYFAQRVRGDVDVPIGLLWEAFPGSIIQEWMPAWSWRLEPELKDLADDVEQYYPNTKFGREVWKNRLAQVDAWMAKVDKSLTEGTPFPYPQPMMPEPGKRDKCGFYNGDIHPLVPLAIKGVLWYQGESDHGNSLWDIELKAMAKSWRKEFSVKGDGEDIPFYWVQIQRSGDYCSPLIRQEQLNALKLVPNSGMAVLLDLDVAVHPNNKTDTGIRLARLALHRDYGKRTIVPCGPIYKSFRVDGDKVTVTFDYADGGLQIGEKNLFDPVKFSQGMNVPNVELAGADGKWHEANARIEGETLVVSSKQVPKPTAVRYCYSNIPEPPFLYNAAGLPAATFTTSQEK